MEGELTFAEAMAEVVNGGKVELCGDVTRDVWVPFYYDSHEPFEVTPRMLWDLHQYTRWRKRP